MKKTLLITAMVLLVTGTSSVLAGGSVMARHGNRGNGTGQILNYDVTAEATFAATVVGQNATYPARTTIKLSDARQLSMVTAPQWYLSQQNFSIEAGQSISVIGVLAILCDNSEGIVAREIVTENGTYEFRTTAGVPLWISRRGMSAAPGNINNCGTLSTTLANLPVQDIDDTEAKGLLHMREEEKLARDVYITLFQKWNINIFHNISQAEQSHMDAIKALLDKYSLEDPVANTTVGTFQSQQFTDLYHTLVEKGNTSLLDALTVGATIEDLDINDLLIDLAATDNDDIRMVYQNLAKGSRNHLRTFIHTLTRNGGTYAPQYLSQDLFDSIISTPMERGTVLDGNGDTSSTCGGNGWGRGNRGGGRNRF